MASLQLNVIYLLGVIALSLYTILVELLWHVRGVASGKISSWRLA